MNYNRQHYYVNKFDPEAPAEYSVTGKGKFVHHSEHETFDEAFAIWKALFLAGESVYIEKDGRCVFNGYEALDSTEPMLELGAAKANAGINENWKF